MPTIVNGLLRMSSRSGEVFEKGGFPNSGSTDDEYNFRRPGEISKLIGDVGAEFRTLGGTSSH